MKVTGANAHTWRVGGRRLEGPCGPLGVTCPDPPMVPSKASWPAGNGPAGQWSQRSQRAGGGDGESREGPALVGGGDGGGRQLAKSLPGSRRVARPKKGLDGKGYGKGPSDRRRKQETCTSPWDTI